MIRIENNIQYNRSRVFPYETFDPQIKSKNILHL